MNNLQTDDQLLEVENEYWVNMLASLDALQRNPDFQRVILDGYFKDKAINGVSLLATQHVLQNNLRSEVMEDLIAVSRLEDFFNTIRNLGTVAPDEDEG